MTHHHLLLAMDVAKCLGSGISGKSTHVLFAISRALQDAPVASFEPPQTVSLPPTKAATGKSLDVVAGAFSGQPAAAAPSRVFGIHAKVVMPPKWVATLV